MQTQNSAKAKNFDFPDMVSSWQGYVSSVDKTNIKPNILVSGSQNVYKKLSGTIAVRQGQKRQGVANATASPISSKFVWDTSLGETYTMVVADTKLYAVKDAVWYQLLSGLTSTRYVFDKWWDNTLKKDVVLFVNGSDNMQMWSGGFAAVLSATTTTITKSGSTSFQAAGFIPTSFSTIGSATTQFDITNPSGTTFRYTFDGTGTDPTITATSVPTGSYILIGAQNFTAANNGIFVVTGSGANYFEVTNAAGVAESNKTIGTGFIYKNYTKVLTIGGVIYAYTGGETTTTLTGVTPDPSAIVAATTILQAVITYPDTPAANFNADFLKVIGNQVYVGSYTSRLIYMSQDLDFTNYVVPSPQIAGSPGLFVMDGTGKGIGARQGNAVIGFGTSGFAVISFSFVSNNNVITRNNKIDIKPVAILQAPLAHEFMGSVGDNLIYLGQDKQVREFGDFNNLFVAGYPSISQEVASELSEETFTGGGLSCIGEFIYITAPNSGRVYLRQERTTVDGDGNVVAERLWHPPFIWNATFIDQIEGVVVAFSNANPQIYEVWDTNQWHDDSPSDEALPYSCVMALGYRGETRRQGLWAFDKHFTEGYLSAGTLLNLLINYDYQGSKNAITAVINSVEQPAYLFEGSIASLGDNQIGQESLGNTGVQDIAEEMNNPIKFKVINSLSTVNCFEWQPVFYSDAADAQWEILATGTNAEVEVNQDATFIINKLRT